MNELLSLYRKLSCYVNKDETGKDCSKIDIDAVIKELLPILKKILDNDSSLVCKRALNTFGADAQIWMAIEETSELLNALAKYRRGRNTADDIITEIADVQVMMEQLSLNFGKEKVEEERQYKLKRLEERLNDYEMLTK